MSIRHAILGVLSSQPITGYDLKKVFQESSFMYWSGNNNQIYRALLELQDEGLVTSELLHSESSPSKKVYTITSDGLAELKSWVLSMPDLPELKNRFLIQLAWADSLTENQLEMLLSRYEDELHNRILLLQEKQRRGSFSPSRTPREAYLWEMIHDNVVSSLTHELEWVSRVRAGLPVENNDENNVNYRIMVKDDQRYIECSAANSLVSEQDALDLVGVCIANDTARILIHSRALPDEFFNLKTGLAGAVLQKFVNYQLKVAAVIPDELVKGVRFRELLNESNQGTSFRTFANIAAAEDWLISSQR